MNRIKFKQTNKLNISSRSLYTTQKKICYRRRKTCETFSRAVFFVATDAMRLFRSNEAFALLSHRQSRSLYVFHLFYAIECV